MSARCSSRSQILKFFEKNCFATANCELFKNMQCLLIFVGLLAIAFAYDNDTEIDPRIFGGEVVEDHRYPFMAYIQYRHVVQCSGTIIHYRWILSAAHCLNKNRLYDITAVVGTDEIDGPDAQTFAAEFIINHWGYTKVDAIDREDGIEYIVMDVGLLRLKDSIIFDDWIDKITLGSPVDDRYVGHVGTVIGWGKVSLWQKSTSLRYMDVEVTTEEECKASWHYADDFLMCIDTSSTSVCYGDSGGPLIINEVQVGIVSTAHPDCEFGTANLLSYVPLFKPWIKKQIFEYSYDVLIE